MKKVSGKGFSWQTLPKPFFVLAPMDDVTDTVFRQIIARAGKPDVMFTEFVNADGLCSPGRKNLLPKLKFADNERPVIAQIWGRVPGNLYQVTREIVSMGFDGIDINMGCPDKTVMKAGSGAALILDRDLATREIRAVKEGAAGNIPVSVKTRIGVKTVETESWIRFLLAQGLDALTVHARTAEEMSRVPARWEEVEKAGRIRDGMRIPTVIIGNGDVANRSQGAEYAEKYGVEGIMIGRGVLLDPWAFEKNPRVRTPRNRLSLFKDHLTLYEKTWGREKSYHILKKYFKIYVQGFENASGWRDELMQTATVAGALKVLSRIKADAA